MHAHAEIENPKSKIQNSIDWKKVNRILVVRLRSIGDTVLTTPSLVALRRFLPEARIDILLEDWVAPVLDGFDAVDNVLPVKTDDLKARLQIAGTIRRNAYDAVFNLHGGTTSTFFTRAAGAKYRIGFDHYRYKFFYNFVAASPAIFWQRAEVHSAEQMLALLGFAGVPVTDKPKSRLAITDAAQNTLEAKLQSKSQDSQPAPKAANTRLAICDPKSKIALIHPAAAFDTKQWATENFARVADFLSEKGYTILAIAAPKESAVLENLEHSARVPVLTFTNLSLPEITALAARAEVFVGNDSGIAHIAAAVDTRSVVIFGSSNINHWRPWTNAPNEIVYEEMRCQPCAGFSCGEFEQPKCIAGVTVKSVVAAIERVLSK